jgi:hypothetical protein
MADPFMLLAGRDWVGRHWDGLPARRSNTWWGRDINGPGCTSTCNARRRSRSRWASASGSSNFPSSRNTGDSSDWVALARAAAHCGRLVVDEGCGGTLFERRPGVELSCGQQRAVIAPTVIMGAEYARRSIIITRPHTAGLHATRLPTHSTAVRWRRRPAHSWSAKTVLRVRAPRPSRVGSAEGAQEAEQSRDRAQEVKQSPDLALVPAQSPRQARERAPRSGVQVPEPARVLLDPQPFPPAGGGSFVEQARYETRSRQRGRPRRPKLADTLSHC